jgi:hypothetical protein
MPIRTDTQNDQITYQIIGYLDLGGAPKVEQTALLRTPQQDLARFLAGQLLIWRYVRGNRTGDILPGYSAELHRGHCRGPLDTGLWTPEHHNNPATDIAYLDTETGSIEWQTNAPTYTVLTEQPPTNVVPLSERRR